MPSPWWSTAPGGDADDHSDADRFPCDQSSVGHTTTWARIKANITSALTTVFQPLATVLTNTTAAFTTEQADAITANTEKDTNVPTALEVGTTTSTTVAITSDGGADDVVIPAATTNTAGLMTAAQFDKVANIALTPTPVKTANYTAEANDYIPCNVAGGGFYIQLPTTPVDRSRVVISNLTLATTSNVLEVKTGGSDKFAVSVGPSSLYLTLLFETLQLQYDADTAVWLVIQTGEPSSFATNFPGIDAQTPITAADISFDLDARTLTIIPPLGYFNIITDGAGKARKFRKDGNVVFDAWDNASGIWYFFFNAAGVPQTSQTAWTVDDFEMIAPVYRFFWNASQAGALRIPTSAFECHLNDIPADTHEWMHLYGAIHGGGLDIASNAATSGSPAADGADTVVALSSGTIIDDNLKHSIENSVGGGLYQQDLGDTTPATLDATNSAIMDVLFMDGGTLVDTIVGTRFPFPYSGSNIPEYVTATGTRTEVTNNYFFSTFVWSVGEPRTGKQVRLVAATTDFVNVVAARAYTWDSIVADIPLLGDNEIRPLYRLIFERKSAYNVGAKHAALREVQDLRKAAVTTSTVLTGSLPASSVTVIPEGDIVSTNQAAVNNELDVKKQAIIAYDTISIPAGAMIPSTTDGAETGTYERTTNKNVSDYFAFDSGATEESIQVNLKMPFDWDGGTVKFIFEWSSDNGSTSGDTVEIGVSGVAINNSNALDIAQGTPQVISDTLLANNGGDNQTTDATPAVTVAGSPSAGSRVNFRVYRNTDGTDDMAEDMWLLSATMQYRKDTQQVAW